MTATAAIHNAPDPVSSGGISTISDRSPSSSVLIDELIDDKLENCAATRALGLQAIPFESPAQLTRELGALGIQTA